MKLVIVGGVAGGASAAARARRLSESAEIILLERGPDVSFANCGLPYHIGGEIADRGKLLVATPEFLRQRMNLDVRTRSNVTKIDRASKSVTVRNLDSGKEYQLSYDKLLLAPGASPFKPPAEGIDLPGIYTLRNLQDTDRIKQAVDAGVQHAVMVGAGFIGLELVENLVSRGVKTTLIELQNQILPPLDREMTIPMLRKLREKGVDVRLGDSAEGYKAAPHGLDVRLKSGETLAAQLVILGVGVRPENALATDAGLEIGPRGGIRVDEFMRTSDPDIYAVGDAVETFDFVLNERAQVPLAGPANRQGRIAADNIFGRNTAFRGTQGTAVVGLFNLSAAMTGCSEKALQRSKRSYRVAWIHPNNHAGYFPGAEQMTLKVTFDPTDGKILGAQGVGGAGVDKRIDVLAVAIQARMTVYDLEQMELCYAPQFGSAKDPVNMLGFVAAGILRGDHPQITAAEVQSQLAESAPYILDVRTEMEFERGHLPNAVNIPVDSLRSRLNEVPTDRPIVAYCQVGMRGYLATRILLQNQRQVQNLSGGYRAWDLFVAK